MGQSIKIKSNSEFGTELFTDNPSMFAQLVRSAMLSFSDGFTLIFEKDNEVSIVQAGKSEAGLCADLSTLPKEIRDILMEFALKSAGFEH